MRYRRQYALCSAQTTVFPLKNAVYSVEGVVCSGEFRIHNPKVGGSSPTPATNKLNNLALLCSIKFPLLGAYQSFARLFLKQSTFFTPKSGKKHSQTRQLIR